MQIPNDFNSSMQITIAICCHNAAERILLPLQALNGQSLVDEIAWEVLVVDNASSDNTKVLVERFAQTSCVPIRVIEEPQLGLNHARRRAASETRSDWIAFCDDDNIPAPDWVFQAYDFSSRHPKVGMFSGKVTPELIEPEVKPKEFDEVYFRLLGCQDKGCRAQQLEGSELPIGAGMVTRTEVMKGIFDEIGIISEDRKGSQLSGCGDLELALVTSKLGWELWYVGEMSIKHLMPPHRLEPDYIDKLLIGSIESFSWLTVLRSDSAKLPLAGTIWSYMSDLGRSVKYRMLSILPTTLHPKLSKTGFYRRFYGSRAKGAASLIMRSSDVNRILDRIASARHTLGPKP